MNWCHDIVRQTRKPVAFAWDGFRAALVPGQVWIPSHVRMRERMADGTRVDREYLLGLQIALLDRR